MCWRLQRRKKQLAMSSVARDVLADGADPVGKAYRTRPGRPRISQLGSRNVANVVIRLQESEVDEIDESSGDTKLISGI